ncbi:MAG: tlyC [Rickettsiales bacterium]|jgi:CBS domain containing-hemolysin-like protein|nr:tlyC [Rickettsiales bacterium]
MKVNYLEDTENNMHMSDDDPEADSGTPRLATNNTANEARPQNSLLKSLRHSLSRLLLKQGGTLEESLVELIEDHGPEGTQLGAEEKTLLHNFLSFHNKKVDDVMVPRMDIIAAEDTASLEELRALVAEHEHTRMPIYHENLDNIRGFLHIKDLIPYFGKTGEFQMDEIIRKALFVPHSMHITDLLAQMRSSRVHMALVMDEYGGTDGLVTIEDLVEELVGDIKDEHDTIEEADLVAINENTLEASGRLPIEKLEERLNVAFSKEAEEDDFDTLGGLIFDLFGYVPKKGERIMHPSGIEFEVLEADPRRVKRALIHYSRQSE